MKAGLEDCMYLCSLLYRSLLVDNVILFLILRLIISANWHLGHDKFGQGLFAVRQFNKVYNKYSR